MAAHPLLQDREREPVSGLEERTELSWSGRYVMTSGHYVGGTPLPYSVLVTHILKFNTSTLSEPVTSHGTSGVC